MLSFVVPAYNEEKYLSGALQAIHAAARGLQLDYEIVVANDASTDATAKLAEEGGARVVNVEHRQISKTRNAGARASAGDMLFFVDADTKVNAAVVAGAIAAMRDGAVGGGARLHFDHPPRWVAIFMAVFELLYFGLARWAAGCFVFCRRDAFEEVGGFDERHFAGEEVMLSIALKKQGRFVILREQVETSARKAEGRTPWDLFKIFMALVFQGMGGVRRRESTQFWYDGKR
jgi:glycosyltransferase involved in cell wall biosynthesis